MSQGQGGGGPLGNQKAKKLSTEELRAVAYKQYCDHLAAGKSKRSWSFEHPDLTLTARAFENYLKNEVDFPVIQREVAETKGYAIWEQIVSDSASGKNTKANTASLQMIMRNKYGWDKLNPFTQNDDTGSSKAIDKLMNHLDSKQSDQSALNMPTNNTINV